MSLITFPGSFPPVSPKLHYGEREHEIYESVQWREARGRKGECWKFDNFLGLIVTKGLFKELLINDSICSGKSRKLAFSFLLSSLNSQLHLIPVRLLLGSPATLLGSLLYLQERTISHKFHARDGFCSFCGSDAQSEMAEKELLKDDSLNSARSLQRLPFQSKRTALRWVEGTNDEGKKEKRQICKSSSSC